MDHDNQTGKFHQTTMQAVLLFIIALIIFSIYGAFLGSSGAQFFFNSLPMSVFWIALLLVLTVGLVFTKNLNSNYGLLFIHLGCILVLVGAMYSSQIGHRFQRKLFGIDKICRGQMIIEQGREDNQILSSDDGQVYQLPFLLRLDEFKIDYYEPPLRQTGPSAIRDFISDVTVIKNGQPVAQKNIEVNHPLHYGGYYFYQQDYDVRDGQYTILQVVSDSGLPIVYSGYLMLGAGVFWHFWLRTLFRTTTKESDGN